MTHRPTSARLSPVVPGTDDIVEELCTALLAHEMKVRAARDGQTRVPQYEHEVLACKIARCESWLRLLGKHTVLANVRAKVGPPLPPTAPRRNERIDIDRAVGARLERAAVSGAAAMATPA